MCSKLYNIMCTMIVSRTADTCDQAQVCVSV